MARHYSPPGTYERIYKHLLEDPTITDAEARLICYLATLPPDWEILPGTFRRSWAGRRTGSG